MLMGHDFRRHLVENQNRATVALILIEYLSYLRHITHSRSAVSRAPTEIGSLELSNLDSRKFQKNSGNLKSNN